VDRQHPGDRQPGCRLDHSIPTLPDTNALIAKADAAKALPGVKLPDVGKQQVPVQEPGFRPHRPLPYRPWAEAVVDRDSGKVVCTLTNNGSVTYHFTVFPNIAMPFAGTPFTVPADKTATYTWDASTTDGVYDFSVHGADGFVRRFAGTVVRGAQRDIPVPSVSAEPRGRKPAETKLDFRLTNDGDTPVRFTITPNDFGGTTRTQWLQAHDRDRAEWPADAHGRYDVTITAADGYTRRYAGTVHPETR
jgi:phospholipase C